MLDPSTRQVSDVKHIVAAAASSSSASRAKQFLETCKCPSSAAAYGSYKELVKDKNVDIIYVATPHSHHYQNTMLCLLNNKHVLCEKAFTVNAAQAKKLVETAKQKNLFLMEAVWTRFFPLSTQIRNMIQSGDLGAIHRVIADLSFGQDVENTWGANGAKHRMVNMDLAGGALLDLGVYPLTWCFQTLYHTVPSASRKPPSVIASVETYATGADEKTSMLLTFPSAPGGKHTAHGIALTNFRVATDPDGHYTSGPAVRIQGTKGEIQVSGPAFRPTHYRFIPKEADLDPHPIKAGMNAKVQEIDCPIPGWGMFWEADECARCIRDGKMESEVMGWEESIVVMETMDQVRRQGGVRYPEKIETVEYPVEL
jgi:predicted dehydrogenase